MSNNADVIIIGGGIMGCSLAYRLAKRGFSAIILEKNTCGSEASGRNSSGVRAQMRDPKELRMAMASQEIWLTLSEELDYNVEYRRIGNLALAYTEERMSEYSARVEREQKEGLSVRMITIEEVKERCPCLDLDQTIDGHSFLGGSLCDSDGTADPLKSTLAYAYASRRLGVKIMEHTEVIGMEKNKSKISLVKTTDGDYSGAVVVNAAGPWGAKVGRMAGVEVPIKPYLDQVCITQQLPPNTLEHYLVIHPYAFWNQTVHGNLLFTNAHTPLEMFPRHDVTYDVIEYLSFITAKLFRRVGLGNLSLIRTYSGWNEVTPDGCGIMGFSKDPENFFINAGYSGHGFCLGPACGIACSELIIDGRTDFPVNELLFGRYEKGETSEVFRNEKNC